MFIINFYRVSTQFPSYAIIYIYNTILVTRFYNRPVNILTFFTHFPSILHPCFIVYHKITEVVYFLPDFDKLSESSLDNFYDYNKNLILLQYFFESIDKLFLVYSIINVY